MPRLQLTLLGGFQARIAGSSTIDIATRKARALLAYLALPPGRRHTRDALVSLLWSDRDQKQANASLRQALVELGRALNPLGRTSVLKHRDTLALDPDAVEVDVVAFERLAATNVTADLERAAALYVGDLLDGLGVRDAAFEEWLLVERQRLRGRAVAILRRLSETRRGSEGLAAAERLIVLDPLQEEGHRALMRLHAEGGEPAVALRCYERCREILKHELNVAPSPETEALHQEIRSGRLNKGTSRQAPSESAMDTHITERPSDKPSIAVLPFVNMSGDPEQEYFSDGITEDITIELSRFRELLVIARNSSFAFKGKAIKVQDIARELDVTYIVEGSVRRVGDRVRITVQLVDARSGNHLWAERYDRNLQEIFVVQDEVVATIVSTLIGRVAAGGAERARRKPPQLWAAYDYFLQGRELQQRFDPGGGASLMRRAIELDPSYAPAYAWLALACYLLYSANGRAEDLEEGFRAAQKAVALDPQDSGSHRALAFIHALMRRFDLAGVHHERAVALNPNDVITSTMRGVWLAYIGRGEEAVRSLQADLRRDPFPPTWYWECYGIALFQTRRYAEVIASFQQMDVLHYWSYCYVASSHAHLGQMDEARQAAAEVLRLKPDFTMRDIERSEWWRDPADLERLKEGLRKAGLPE